MATRRPAEVFPPGEFLREELEARGWTQDDLAAILGRTTTTVNQIIGGQRSITPATARGLAAALGTTPQFWLNLESAYQLWKVQNDPKRLCKACQRTLASARLSPDSRSRQADAPP